MERFYSSFEVAKLCQVSPGSVVRWIHEGKLPASQTGGGHHRVRDEDLVKFLESLRMPIPAELQDLIKVPSRKSILIVDDDYQIRRFIKDLLQDSFPDIAIEEANNGFSAGWLAKSMKPDLVLLDLKMSGMDGFQFCKHMRAVPELSRTKIMIITGFGNENRAEIEKMGADDFLQKPFESKTLERKIMAMLGLNVKKEIKEDGGFLKNEESDSSRGDARNVG